MMMGSLDFDVPSRVGPCSTRDSQGCIWSFYYVGLTEVGRGGFGVVFSAKREYFRPRPGTDGRTYAIKFLRAPSAGQEEELRARIATEKAVHERLKDANCPHLVTPISFLNLEVSAAPHQGRRTVDIIVTEFCDGGDLLHALNTGARAVPETEARCVVGQVSKGLSAIHAAGFIHRDVKEANIFIAKSPSGTVTYKLGDFGLATSSGQINRTMCGTKTFMAPEIDGRTAYGPEVDIWSLGVLLYTLLAGAHPFKAGGRGLECSSPEARDLVARTMTRDPKARMSLDQVLSHPFVTGVKMSMVNSRMADSGISSGSMTSSRSSTVPQSPAAGFVPLRPLAEERSKAWPSKALPVSSTNSILQKTVAANMPSTYSSLPGPGGGNLGVTKESTKGLLPPLTTRRLRPSFKKHQFKVGSGVIGPEGQVSLEFNITKRLVQNGAATTVSCIEHMTISADGTRVEVWRGQEEAAAAKVYSHNSLPAKYWPKYNYAAKFVNIVKESTPKITFYTDRAMCRLMENGPPDANFEVHFYNGVKFVYSAAKGIQVTESGSNSVPEQYSVNTVSVDSSRQAEWAEFQRCHERAKRLESQFEGVAGTDGNGGVKRPGDQFFPLTLGKRPASLSAPPPPEDRLPIKSIISNQFVNNYLPRTNSSPNSLNNRRIFMSS